MTNEIPTDARLSPICRNGNRYYRFLKAMKILMCGQKPNRQH